MFIVFITQIQSKTYCHEKLWLQNVLMYTHKIYRVNILIYYF